MRFEWLPSVAGGSVRRLEALCVRASSLLTLPGKRYDCGSKLGYLQATVEYGLKHPSLGPEFANYLHSLVPKLS